jgi:hypothetical protein
MSTANKLSYLNDTKSLLRTSLNKFGSNILSTDTFRSYDTKLNEIYDKLPKVTATGQGLTISNVQNGLLDDFKINGVDLEQDTTETIIINDWEQGDISGSTGDTVSDNSTIRTQQYIKVFPNVLYNISRTIYNSFMKFRFYDTNYNFLGTQGNVNITTNVSEDRMTANVSSMQLTINDSSVAYMKIADASNNLNTIYTITTNATPSPNYPQDIKVVEGRQVINVKGKNLFDINSGINTNNLIDAGITSVFNADGTITVNGEKTADYKYIRYSVTLPAGTYYFCGCPSGGSNSSYSSLVQLTQDVSSQVFDIGNGGTFTLTEQTTIQYFPVRVGSASLTFNNTIFKPMISTTPITYDDFEPYYEPVSYNIDLQLANIYLAQIPNTDYKNRIYKNNGNWYFEENVKKIVLDGSEVITIQNIGTNNWYYQLSVNCYKTDQLKQICSHYNNSGIYNSNTYEGIMMLTDGNFIRIRYGEEDTVANFKMWLSNNNVELWYPLINSITTQITNTTLINQLEALYLHTGTNIITISNSNNIIPEIEMTRLKELEKLA